MTGLIFHVDEWKGLCYDGPDALSILAPQMEQRWHFIMICRPPWLSRLHAGGSDGNGCVSSVEVKLMFLPRRWANRLIHANVEKASEEAEDV